MLKSYSKKQVSPSWLNKARWTQVKKEAEINRLRRLSTPSFVFRGNNAELWNLQGEEEILLCGAAGTGKTLAILFFINEMAWQYPGLRVLIVRKVRVDLTRTTLVTYERDVMKYGNPIVATVQRESRKVYRYPNGSEIVIGGMDRPGSILSGEYDIIYPAEAVQFTLNDWETLIMRLRSGVYPYPAIIGDTNPDRKEHWLKQRADEGVTKLLNTYHKDNPAYWDEDAQTWTPAGVRYVLGKLSRLTGVRKERYLLNRWVNAEGVIYEGWNEDIHLIDADELPAFRFRFCSIDFGFTNPFVCQWWGVDHDGRMYLYREIYQTRLLVEDAADMIKRLNAGISASDWDEMDKSSRKEAEKAGEKIQFYVSDHDAEDRETLRRRGIATRAADKSVSEGLQEVMSRLRVEEDGKPRLFIVRGARDTLDRDLKADGLPTSTQEEIGGYIWNDKKQKDEPVKADDHGMDTMRYAAMANKNQRRNIFIMDYGD